MQSTGLTIVLCKGAGEHLKLGRLLASPQVASADTLPHDLVRSQVNKDSQTWTRKLQMLSSSQFFCFSCTLV